jgi:hypothetical protein
MTLTVEVENPLLDYKEAIKNDLDSIKESTLHNLNSFTVLSLSDLPAQISHKLKNGYKIQLKSLDDSLVQQLIKHSKSNNLYLVSHYIEFAAKKASDQNLSQNLEQDLKSEKIPLIINKLSIDEANLIPSIEPRLNPYLTNLLFNETGHYTLTNKINEAIINKSLTTSSIVRELSSVLNDIKLIDEFDIVDCSFNYLDLYNEIDYFRTKNHGQKLINSIFVAAKLNQGKSRKKLTDRLNEENINNTIISREILTKNERNCVRNYINNKSFNFDYNSKSKLVEAFYSNSNNSKLSTLLICSDNDKPSIIEKLSAFENSHIESLATPIYGAKTKVQAIQDIMFSTSNEFKTNLKESIEKIILNKKAKFFDSSENADFSILGYNAALEVTNHYEQYRDTLEKVAELGIFSTKIKTNSWFGSIVESDSESIDIITNLEMLKNDLLPFFDIEIEKLPKLKSIESINNFNDLGILLEFYSKLIDILDFFKPEIVDANFDLFIDVLSDEPNEHYKHFEKKAILAEAKKCIRNGVNYPNDAYLYPKFFNAKQVVEFFKENVNNFDKSIIPHHLKEIESRYKETIEILTNIEARSPKLNIDCSLIDLDFSTLKSKVELLLNDGKLILDQLDKKSELLSSLGSISEFIEAIYLSMPNDPNANINIKGLLSNFELYLNKSIYTHLIKKTSDFARLDSKTIQDLWKAAENEVSYATNENYFFIATINELEKINIYDYDSIILYNIKDIDDLHLYPILYRTSNIVNISNKKFDWLPNLSELITDYDDINFRDYQITRQFVEELVTRNIDWDYDETILTANDEYYIFDSIIKDTSRLLDLNQELRLNGEKTKTINLVSLLLDYQNTLNGNESTVAVVENNPEST